MNRTLHMTNPLMKGSDVRTAQTRLANHNYLPKDHIDGSFGTMTGKASELAKYMLGYPSSSILPTYGTTLDNYLSGKTKLPKEYKARQAARRNVPFIKFEEQAIRAKILATCKWGVTNTSTIHYQQKRPIDGINHPYELPIYTDCSGFVTLCYKWAGAPDPNGRGFDGLGYTGTLLQHCKPILKTQLKIGDIVVWGNYPGHHTALVTALGVNPMLCSHGKEADPHFVSLSTETSYQPSPVHYLRIPEWF